MVDWQSHPNQAIRIGGRDPSARALLCAALAQGDRLIRAVPATRQPPFEDDRDDARIDPDLPVTREEDEPAEPATGSGYAGLTALQRGAFYRWLHDPLAPAAPAYQLLYLAQLETNLFAGPERSTAARREILRLLHAGSWTEQEALVQVGLLAGWLAQEGSYLAAVIGAGMPAPAQLGVGLGWQALLGTPLAAAEVLVAQRVWGQAAPGAGNLPLDLVQLNIDSLATTLDADPLHHALEAQSTAEPASREDEERETAEPALLARWQIPWTPWRTIHRDLRILLPQPDLRPSLQPLLAELLKTAPAAPVLPPSPEPSRPSRPASGAKPAPDWHLVLEFGESRSHYYEWVLEQARKQPGYRMLMDETRQIVHRVTFRKGQMRHFWRLWDYVQNWASTRVYRNGEELEKWQIWPYSQYLR